MEHFREFRKGCVMQKVPISDGSGMLERYLSFPSQFVEPRNVDVWLPPDYTSDGARRYPVIYLQDGQNLFDPALAYVGVDWGVDEAVLALVQSGQIRAPIIVGIWNSAKRWREYMPQNAYERNLSSTAQAQFNAKAGGRPTSDYYLRFLVEELKPAMDADFRTLPGPAHTFIMGSSLGALVSLYALLSYPQVFGGAGCLSTHWLAGGDGLIATLQTMLPKPGSHRFYFDYGTETLDAEYEPFQHKMDMGMQTAGYVSGRDWVTHKIEGAEHSETSWRERVHIPLQFLLGA